MHVLHVLCILRWATYFALSIFVTLLGGQAEKPEEDVKKNENSYSVSNMAKKTRSTPAIRISEIPPGSPSTAKVG